jgi:hypothetical protein
MGSSIPKEDQHEHRTPEHGNENLWNEINAADGTQQGIWIVLDTLNGFGTWSVPPTICFLTSFSFASALAPSTSTTPILPEHCQLYLDPELPSSGLFPLFFTFVNLTSVYSTTTTLPLP